jgi:hypothetical protein
VSAYRHYRGLYGETVLVASASIAPAEQLHCREAFPFAAAAKRIGERRNQFAAIALQCPWIEETMSHRIVQRMLAANR